MKIVIIVPTYNERGNVGRLLSELRAVAEGMTHDLQVLVVDDSSPDGTAQIVEDFRRRHPNIHLIVGRKAGLGKAYIRGIRYAIDVLGADAIMEMDADFSHDPSDIPRLVNKLDCFDFIIGSRYVSGGSVSRRWSAGRRMLSKYGNIFTRWVAGMGSVKDCTAGFRAISTDLLRRIDIDSIDANGYCFQIQLLHRAMLCDARILEVPVHFKDRRYGESKLGRKDIFGFFWQVWMIRLATSEIFLKFSMVGLSGVLVNLGAMTLLIQMGVNKFIASPLSIELSILSNFFLNRFFTFKSRRLDRSLGITGLMFNAVSILSLTVSYTTFLMLTTLLPHLPPQIPQLLGILPATVINYLLNAYWTFRARSGKAGSSQPRLPDSRGSERDVCAQKRS